MLLVIVIALALLFLAHIAVTALWPYLTPQPTTYSVPMYVMTTTTTTTDTTYKDGPHE